VAYPARPAKARKPVSLWVQAQRESLRLHRAGFINDRVPHPPAVDHFGLAGWRLGLGLRRQKASCPHPSGSWAAAAAKKSNRQAVRFTVRVDTSESLGYSESRRPVSRRFYYAQGTSCWSFRTVFFPPGGRARKPMNLPVRSRCFAFFMSRYGSATATKGKTWTCGGGGFPDCGVTDMLDGYLARKTVARSPPSVSCWTRSRISF